MEDNVVKTILDHAERAAELSLECVRFIRREIEKERGIDEESVETSRRELTSRIFKIIVDAGDHGTTVKKIQDKIYNLRGPKGSPNRNLAESVLADLLADGKIEKWGFRYFHVPQEARD